MTSATDILSGPRREALLGEWLRALRALWTSSGLGENAALAGLEPGLSEVLQEILRLLALPPENLPTADADPAHTLRLRTFISTHARAGVPAVATAEGLHVLRRLLRAACLEAAAPVDDTQQEAVLDLVLTIAFGVYMDSRERIIAEQSLSLLELSTPVLRVWNRVLLLPLVGVVDTARARQFTERLLEAVARHEALVTIIDVTGVPVLDTSVAQHLMKTIDAARLLGTRIVMTGISPEGAQTLTKLGIRFSDVVSRASLRAGIAEALFLLGQGIVNLPSPAAEGRG